MITFHYIDTHGKNCTGEISILYDGDPLEIEVEANGWTFHVIAGTEFYGNRFLCIPNWDIGSGLARINDEFWNEERLLGHTTLHPDNVRAIVKALAVADEWIRKYEADGCG